MKRLLFVILVVLLVVAPSTQNARAAESTNNTRHLLIRQAYFGSTTDSSDEFITIANTSIEKLNIGGMTIEYKAATGKNWYEKAQVETDITLTAGQTYTFATKRERDAELGSGLAQAGGNLRLMNAKGEVLDMLAWGTGDSPEGIAITAPTAGSQLIRKLDSYGIDTDTNDNSSDFEVVNLDGPITSGTDALEPSTVSTTTASAIDASVEITELLPNPKTPASDSSDEFIELYNAGSETINLVGWKLQDAAGHSAKLDGTTLVPGQYLALMSSQTKLSLNNSGDTIALINPLGDVVMESPNYAAAKEGLSFGASSDGWGWLLAPTPNAANSVLAAADVVSSTSSKAKTKNTTAKATTKKQTKSTVSKTPKLAKVATAADGDQVADLVNTQSETVSWVWLVASLGVLALGYGVYEYRPEIISFITKLRAKFSSRS